MVEAAWSRNDFFIHEVVFLNLQSRICLLTLYSFIGMVFTVNGLFAVRDWAHTASDLSPDSRVVWGHLENGFRYALLPHTEPPGRVSLRLYIAAGSLMEQDEEQGLAHFLEHMAFNGTRHFPPGEMVEYFQRIGMAFGADTNAHTGFEETVYKIELPDSDPELREEGLRVFRDFADGMLLLEEEIEKERGVILSEKRARDSSAYREFVARWRFLFPDSLLSSRFPIGRDEVIEYASRRDFLDFYKSWYTADRMALVVVGEMNPSGWIPLIEAFFGDLPRAEPRPDPNLGAITHPGVTARLHSEHEAQAVQVSLQTVHPFAVQQDTRTRRLRELYRTIAYDILSRRLRVLSKQREASFYEGRAYAFDYLNFCEVGAVTLVCSPDQWRSTIETVEQVVRRALKFGFTKSEARDAGAKVLEELEQSAISAATQRSRDVADALVQSISQDRVFTHPQTDFERARTALQTVTPEQCHAAFSELWNASDRYLFVSGNLELENAETLLLEAFKDSTSTEVAPPQEGTDVPFAYTDFGTPGEVVSEQYIEDLDIYQVRFANNVRLNFKPTDFQANTVHIGVRFGGGKLEALPRQPGLSLLAETAFIEGGLTAHSVEQWESILAGRTVSAALVVGDDAFVLKGVTTPEDLLLQLQLLGAYLTHPAYREEAVDRARRSFDALYRQLSHTAEGTMQDRVARFLASGDFRFGFPKRDDVLARTIEELKAWLRRPLSEGYLEISIVGDVDPTAAKAAVAATFGALMPRRALYKPSYEVERTVTFPKGVRATTFNYPTELQRAVAAVYWPTTDISHIRTTRRLNLLARIFSDRLRLRLREEAGEGYSPYALNQPSVAYPGYGFFYGINLARPDQVTSVTKAIKAIGATLARDGVTVDEYKRALEPTLNFIKDYVRDNQYWLNVVLMRSQESPERLEWARTLSDDYAAITLEQMNHLAREFLASERSIAIEVIPKF